MRWHGEPVVLKHQEVAAILTPPLAGLGFLTPSLAPRGRKTKANYAFIIRVVYSLQLYCGESGSRVAEIKSEYSPGHSNGLRF